jgi:hypothetical protein
MGGVEEIFSKCCKFFKHEKLVLHVFESIKFQRESVRKRVLRFIESLKCVEERSLSC